MLEHVEAADSTEIASPQDSPTGFGDPPIDLVHLSRQCQGDPSLEEELLGLFRAQAGPLAAQLSDPHMRLELKAGLAHKLRGSALTIGAGRVVRAAEAVEEMGLAASDGATTDERRARVAPAIAALQAAVAQAVAEIDRLRD